MPHTEQAVSCQREYRSIPDREDRHSHGPGRGLNKGVRLLAHDPVLLGNNLGISERMRYPRHGFGPG